MTSPAIYRIKTIRQFENISIARSLSKGDAHAIGIVRVSSHGQKDNNSEAVQIAEIQKYAEGSGLALVVIFCIVESAKDSDGRRIFNRIEEWAKSLGVQHRVFYKPDREARNLTDIEYMLSRVKSGEIVVHYALDRKVLNKDISPNEYLMRQILASLDAHYSVDLGHKVSQAKIVKAESGWYPGSHTPLGYLHQKETNAVGVLKSKGAVIAVDPNPQRVRQVQREFELRADGYSYEQIRRQIIAEGFIAASKVASYRACTIEKRIKNKFYGGFFNWSGREYKGCHALIIDPNTYARAQDTLGLRGGYSKSLGVFSGGWLKCGAEGCGCNIVYDPKKKTLKNGEEVTYHFYHCTNGRKAHMSLKGMNVTDEKLWEQFHAVVKSISITPEWAKQLATALNETRNRVQVAIKRDIDNYKLKLKALESTEDRLYDDFCAGVLDDDGYRRQLGRVRESRSSFTDLLQQAQLRISDAGLETAQTILELATNAELLWKSRQPYERLRFLKLILSNQVLEGSTIRYQLKKPLETLSEMKGNDKWRRERDSNSR